MFDSLNSTDKSFMWIFLILTFLILFSISPMGRLFLPVNKSSLENNLAFTLDPSFTLKAYDVKEQSQWFHLVHKNFSPHVISILIDERSSFPTDVLTPQQTKNPLIQAYWDATGYQNVVVNDCLDSTIKEKPVKTCSFSADKPDLNHKEIKEGQLAFFTQNDYNVFIAATAPKLAYNQENLSVLLHNILGI